jgi:CheY-like chemotaxis protein
MRQQKGSASRSRKHALQPDPDGDRATLRAWWRWKEPASGNAMKTSASSTSTAIRRWPLLRLLIGASRRYCAKLARLRHPAASEWNSSMTSAPGDRHRVLLVEDEFVVALMMEELLRGAEFVVVGPVPRLQEAVQAACALNIDIALLDVDLGGLLVFPAAEALAKWGIPFIFMTGGASHALPEKFRDRPTLDKPFLPARLLGAIATALGRPASPVVYRGAPFRP